MDDNYIINKIIDILNSQNQNLLIGNITSPRPGSICQVSTPYGIKSAYNINCTYPGDACIVWDKDENRYYAFSVNPSRVINSKQLSFRKNREVVVKKTTGNFIKILYSVTTGSTVNIYVGGCYETPKLLYTYTLNQTPTIVSGKIDSTGKGENDWIVGLVEKTGEFNYTVTTRINSNTGTTDICKCITYEGSTTPTYISPEIKSIRKLTGIKNLGYGFFQGDVNLFITSVPPINTVSYNSGITNFNATYGTNKAYSATITNSFPNVYKGQVTYSTYNGIAQVNEVGNFISGTLTRYPVDTGLEPINGLLEATGQMYLSHLITKNIRSTFPNIYGTINGNPYNTDKYITRLLGNNGQCLYQYIYYVQDGLETISNLEFNPTTTYAVTNSYGEIATTFYLPGKPTFFDFDIPYLSWINNNIIRCSNAVNVYTGTGVKETTLAVYKLLPNGDVINGEINPSVNIKAKVNSIPNEGTIKIISASYYDIFP